MRARQARRHALMVGCLLWSSPSFADDAPSPPKKAAAPSKAAVAPKLPPLPGAEATPAPTSTPLAPASAVEVERERLATVQAIGDKDKPPPKPMLEVLQARLALLDEWKKAVDDRQAAESPKRSPEAEAAALKAELEKIKALLDQAAKGPDALLPEVFRAVEGEAKDKDKEAEAKRAEARLGEMKESIDSARADLKDQSAQFESLRAEGARALLAEIAALRPEREKAFQALAGLNAQRGERPAPPAATASPEARDLALGKLANLDWQARVEAERLAAIEAKLALDARRIDLGTLQLQTRAARVQLAKTLANRMEARYDALAERRRNALKQAVAKEETRAANSVDPLERRRAQRTAQLLELESQVLAYEKAYATSGGSLQEQENQKDRTVTDFEELKKLLDDGSVSPLDALRLKNDFRRIGPERAQVVRTDLAASEAELTSYENALTDAEIDLVNDSRDDRFDRESLLELLPPGRRGEANAMLEGLESRHKALLNRRRDVLRNLARRAEETHACVLKRIETLDLQYAFIRTHIFWIRDAEPVGMTTLAHARDDSIRTAKALVHLAMEAGDRTLWARPSPAFLLAAGALLVMPLPLWLGRRALDRMRLVAVDR